MPPVLTVDELIIGFDPARPVVNEVSFTIDAGEKVGLWGPSGSGKSMIGKAIVSLLPPAAEFVSGKLKLTLGDDVTVDLLTTSEEVLRSIRGTEIGMVWQDPATALNPTHTIARALGEVAQLFTPPELLDMVHLIGDQGRILASYPHQLSGGQLQRIIIAIALAKNPRLLIADEPTTALDSLTETALLDLLDELVTERKIALLLITHDESILRTRTHRVIQLQAGRIVADGPVAEVLGEESRTARRQQVVPGPDAPVLTITDLNYAYHTSSWIPFRKPAVTQILSDVNLEIRAGEWVALTGPSGCGKSTLASNIVDAQGDVTGSITVARGGVQLIPQNALASLNPRHTVARILKEVLSANQNAWFDGTPTPTDLLARVKLTPEVLDRKPDELSGGQQQRLVIARALAAHPSLLIADESVSALDAAVQREILSLFSELLRQRAVGLLFISHDIRLVRAYAGRVVIIRAGKLVEVEVDSPN
ncbi:ABC transporter ATP-binding protein [Neolewinella antarctica]|uniref:ABC-type glutathione transport system ATPase component n=1 Tax=Neolewinella antarctica TaxID=442734 RepID=A0ABX0X6F5_9BACT|nr:ATP-binding cassette domain-containing protein [Neolewinella antarctica]NJC24776.1 ABC-type glutathione transport system ATPase component [Neolewinella antarctica]